MLETPIYLFTGFLDSGKTTLIKDTLEDPTFNSDDPTTLIICLEQGEEEYSEEYLALYHAEIEYLDSSVYLDNAKLKTYCAMYHPTQIFIECNGLESITEIVTKELDEQFPIAQIITTIDATTFTSYMNNMRSYMYEQIRYSDLIIFNRCTSDSSKNALRGSIKAVNKKAFIAYEGNYGEQIELKKEELPFDINADIIDISDDDYGIWYMDALENPDKYDQKKVRIKGMFLESIPNYHNTFIMGRKAMVCCGNDLQSLTFTVTGVKVSEMQLNDWLEIEGEFKAIPLEDGEKTLVLYASLARFYHQPDEPLVYFS
ncbi:MAG: GTP-binding protein [Erysipelotrichaceae bacterium]|nr:GTP-binding protein [Erysipelotrichaceae bacterium]